MSLVADERTAVRVGGFSIVAAAVAVVFVVAVAPQLALGRAVRVRVYYGELAGLREGAPVQSAGAVIGRVESISLSPAGRAGPLEGQAGAVVHLALEPDALARAWREGTYVISSRGVLSARYLEIIPPPAGRSLASVVEGEALRGLDPPTLDRVLARTWTNLLIAKRFFDSVRPEARQLRDELDQLARQLRELDARAAGASGGSAAGANVDRGAVDALVVELRALGDQAERTWQGALGGRTGTEQLRSVLDGGAATWRLAARVGDELAAEGARLRAMLAQVSARLAAATPGAKVAALIAQSRALAERLAAVERGARVVWLRWQRREGTLGRLLADPEFPEDAKELGKILKRQPWRIIGHPDD